MMIMLIIYTYSTYIPHLAHSLACGNICSVLFCSQESYAAEGKQAQLLGDLLSADIDINSTLRGGDGASEPLELKWGVKQAAQSAARYVSSLV